MMRAPALGRFFLATRRRRCRVTFACSSSTSRSLSVSNNSDSTTTTTIIHDTPIVIVGGGPSGLLLSNLLSSYNNTPHVVLEALSVQEKFLHPQAHFINTRSMEILRHCLPHVYKRTKEAMEPVTNWRDFSFGYSMAHNNMATVRHPVDQPLMANNQDANGVLLPLSGEKSTTASSTSSHSNNGTDDNIPLSVCTVGHLAQHTFCRILYDAALKAAADAGSDTTQISYNRTVTHVERDEASDNKYLVHCENDTDNTTIIYRSSVVVAADGANSLLRRDIWKIPQHGQECIQHLMNVHVRTTTSQTSSSQQHYPKKKAMLYSIYHPKVLGMMVRHSQHEFVLQIPYFPPYQTVERNFSKTQVQSMVEAAFHNDDDDGVEMNIEIVSIRPWIMSSLVAERYYHDDHHSGGVLVGDAAHQFPPAGGFGMNTGLQDVHNLAWRVSWWWNQQQKQQHQESDKRTTLVSLLKQYDKERRPIAQRNAALSVRNYRRILELSKACYLNERHPAALIKLLDSMSPFVSLETRQNMFQSLLQAAMMPLSALKHPSSLPAQHLINNIRRILGRGEGLPLLFPKYELGFGYDDGSEASRDVEKNETDYKDDTKGFLPRIKVGYLFPHAELELLSSPEKLPHLQPITKEETDDSGSTVITSSDLPSQLRIDDGPCFALVMLQWERFSMHDAVKMAESLSESSGMPIVTVNVVGLDEQTVPSAAETPHVIITLRDAESKLQSMLDSEQQCASLVLVRPDGHVASVVHVQDDESLLENASRILLRDLLSSLGVQSN